MKTEDIEKLGNLSKARRIVNALDSLWDILLDATVFRDVPEKEVEAVEVPLANARAAAANLMSRYGDNSAYLATPRPKRNHIKESETGEK
jgi:hypothetical protein